MSGRTGAYAGMSNDKAGENPARRKPKVSWGREIRPGLAGALVEAERRRRWIAGQHSCAACVDRGRDGVLRVIGTDRNVRGVSRGGVIGKSARHKPSGKPEGIYVPEVTGRTSKKSF